MYNICTKDTGLNPISLYAPKPLIHSQIDLLMHTAKFGTFWFDQIRSISSNILKIERVLDEK